MNALVLLSIATVWLRKIFTLPKLYLFVTVSRVYNSQFIPLFVGYGCTFQLE